jgi:hypothetical protein
MICLWSAEYFSSPWCQAELGHMLARRDKMKEEHGPLPLILAAVIHDGEKISPNLGDIQRLVIKECASPWLAPNGPRSEELSEHIHKLSVHVAHALGKAPACDPSWPGLAIEDFVRLFEYRATQRDVPSLGR